ncbi:MAG: TrmB family transcriptional regulator [Candidatus Magasanikbacteria bacterium]|nr:TrmB family transcriptional regulator [Candidatus Magasanikbacteria bacterium]
MYNELLNKLGFSDKSVKIYLALLQLGPSSVRKLAEFCELNRGTTYDTLKWLQEKGVVTFYQKQTKQYFVAENPEKLLYLAKNQETELKEAQERISRAIPELQALYNKGGERPVARYYEKDELNLILEDILASCEEDEEKTYRIYSAEGVKEYLYGNFPTFSDVRITKGIRVRVISLGGEGELRGLDERKCLKAIGDPLLTSPYKWEGNLNNTYIIIYPGKTAYISLNAKKEPIGVVVENDGVFETQKIIFDNLWNRL